MGTFETSTGAPTMAARGGNPDISQRLPDKSRSPAVHNERLSARLGKRRYAINCTDFAPMSQVARPTLDWSVGLGAAVKRAHIRVGLESGISSISGNDRDVGETGSRARNPALERNHWGQRVRVEGKGDERQRPRVADEATRPSPDKTEPTQREA
jgi:hypothetical protein